MTEQIFASLLYYLIPTFIGRGLWGISQFLAKTLTLPHLRRDNRHFSFPFVSYFIIGASFVFITALILQYAVLPMSSTYNFIHIFVTAILAIVGVTCFGNLYFWHDIQVKKYILPTALSIFLAVIVYSLWQLNSPYPFNWDMYEHQTLVNTVLQGRFSFFPTHITDTFGFNGYSSLYHILITTSQVFFQINLFDYWHSISFVHFVLVILTSYLLGYEVSQNRIFAVISALLGALIFDSTLTFTSLFFLPQTFTALLFVQMFMQLIADVKKGVIPSIWLVGIYVIFLFLSHYIIGFVAMTIYLSTYLYVRFHPIIVSKFNWVLLIESGLVFAFVVILFSANIPLGFLNKGEGAAFTYTMHQKFSIMQQTYGYMLLLFLPIGLSVVFKKKTELEVLLFTITLGLIAIIVANLPYVLKFFVIARYFVHLLIVAGIYRMLRTIHIKIFQSAALLGLGAVLLGIFITNAAYWKSNLYDNGITTHVSPKEIEAAQYLRKYYSNDNTLLISDPATQHILEPLARVNTQGGAYMDIDTRKSLHWISQQTDTVSVARILYDIKDKIEPISGKRLLALSGRYFVWQNSNIESKESLAYNIWYPAGLTLENYKTIRWLQGDPFHFTLIFENPSIVIFEVRN